MTTFTRDMLQPITLRAVTSDAGPALHAMLTRCSPDSLRARFLGTNASAAEQYVHTVLTDDRQVSVLAWQDDRVLAVGSILYDSSVACAEIGLLVEDVWQHKGLGDCIASLLIEAVSTAGLDYLCAHLGVTNLPAHALITRMCPNARWLHPENGVLDVVIPVDGITTTARPAQLLGEAL